MAATAESVTTETVDNQTRAAVLCEALPYIRRFADSVVVIKLGGHAMADEDLLEGFAADVVLLRSVGIQPVVVHGGGPQIGELMERLGKEASFVDGLRVTDAETLDIARMVLVGKVGREIVGRINAVAPIAVGLSGEDAGLIRASARHPDLGFVGDVDEVDPTLLVRLLAEDLIPVVSTIGASPDGQAYNINADTVAAAVAGALSADKILFLTDVAGLRSDADDPASLLSAITTLELDALLASGDISGGMIPKVEAARAALAAGVGAAHIVDGREPHVILLELLTDEGVGTMIESEDGR